MAENNNRQEYVKIVLTLVMSLSLILFTQWVKLFKNPKSTPITKETIFGLVILGVFSILGIFIHGLVQKLPIKNNKGFSYFRMGFNGFTCCMCSFPSGY